MTDVVFPLGPGLEWTVRAYHFDTLDEARKVWAKYEGSTRGGDWNFSVWAVSTPAMDEGLVVFCGAADELPVVTEGELVDMPYGNAREFALRRARTSLDALAEHPDETYFETRDRYGTENPMKVDEEGRLRPYRK